MGSDGSLMEAFRSARIRLLDGNKIPRQAVEIEIAENVELDGSSKSGKIVVGNDDGHVAFTLLWVKWKPSFFAIDDG